MDPLVRKIPWRTAWQPTPIFLPGESPWTEEPGGLQSMGLQRVEHDSATKHSLEPGVVVKSVGSSQTHPLRDCALGMWLSFL